MATTLIPANAKKVATSNGGYQWLVGNQAYVPPSPPEPDVVAKGLTAHFPANSSNYLELIRIQWAATVDLAAAELSNVGSVTYYVNGVSVSGTQAIDLGDEFSIEIVRTSPAADASVFLSFEYAGDFQNETVPDYKYVTWTNLVEMSVDSATWESSNRGVIAAVNGTDAFDKGASSAESVEGLFTVELDALNLGSVFGISLNNSDGPSLNRAKYAWYCFGNGRLDIYANGGAIDTLFVARNNAMIYNLRIVDTGTGIEFYYRAPSGAWTLKTTTTAGYSAGTTYYASLVSSIDGQRTRGVKIYE